MSGSSSTRRHVRHAQGYIGLGMLKAAAAELESIESAEQCDPEVMSVHVELHMEGKQWEELVTAGSRLARTYPANEHAWIAWAYALRELNRVTDARAVLLEAEPRHGRMSAVLHYNLACYDSLLGSIASARERFATACRMDRRFEVEGRLDPDLKRLRETDARTK
jgi:predicted Zn-dependent protease